MSEKASNTRPRTPAALLLGEGPTESSRTPALQAAWKRLCRTPWPLLVRYSVWPSYRKVSLWEGLWWISFHACRLAGLACSRLLFQESWHPGLRHGCTDPARTVVLLDDLEDGEAMHTACLAVQEQLTARPQATAAVLVTARSDFSFYSRLGWLVEYLPASFGEQYRNRKLAYLAWRYKNALVLPLSDASGNIPGRSSR